MADVMALSDCEICSRLAEVETSFAKYGSDDAARPLPPEAARLTPVGDLATLDAEHHVRRCPLCGMLYRYDWSYEYLVNGSEDEELLVRLTPDEARAWLSEGEYAARIALAQQGTGHPSALTRRYAGKCLASHYLVQQDCDALSALLRQYDAQVVGGALEYLARLVWLGEALDALTPLRPTLVALAESATGEVAERARYLAGQLQRYAARDGPGAGG